MAEHTHDDPNRVTPREVPPDRRDPSDAPRRERDTGDDRPSGRSLRREPEVVEPAGGDQAGIAGGGLDSDVSGVGGSKTP